MRQETEWGYIDWKYLPDAENPKRWFSAGVVTIMPGQVMTPHIHYNNEQVLYVLEGEAIYKLNGVEHHVHPGDTFFLESDTTHEGRSLGDVPYRELMVTNPMPRESEPFRGLTRARLRNAIAPEVDRLRRQLLRDAAEELRSGKVPKISVPHALYDADGELLTSGGRYPEVCTRLCDPLHNLKNCPCQTCSIADGKPAGNGGPELLYVCPHGISVFLLPLLMDDRIIGILRGGQHFSSKNIDPSQSAPQGYDTPLGTELSILKSLSDGARALITHSERLESAEVFSSQRKELDNFILQNSELERNLADSEEKITDLKINHHFLFNTLNSLAGIALEEESMLLYSSIIDLAKMFRYTMAQGERIVSLSTEIEYLRSYLNLQKLRYQDRLEIKYDLDPDCETTRVPFNFLQPVVENAFTHSFAPSDQKMIVQIRIRKDGDLTRIECENNGTPPDIDQLPLISHNMKSHTGHGLSFIYDKLSACCGEDFSMEIEITPEQHTLVSITIKG